MCRYTSIIYFSHAFRGRLGSHDLPAPRRPLPSRFPRGLAAARPPLRPRPSRTAALLNLLRDHTWRAAFRDLAVCALIGAALVLVLGLTAGCTSPAAPAPSAPAPADCARVELVNLSSAAWQIVFTPPSPQPPVTIAVAPRATVAVTLTPGDYTVTQTITSGPTASPAPVRFPTTLARGESYTWPLATLLTAAGAVP